MALAKYLEIVNA